jgi:hypothetical protein
MRLITYYVFVNVAHYCLRCSASLLTFFEAPHIKHLKRSFLISIQSRAHVLSPPPPGGRYTLVLSAPQWAYLSKLEVLQQPGVQVEQQPDGSVIVCLSQEHYSIFLNSISSSKPRTNVTVTDITVEVDAGEWSRVPLVALLGPPKKGATPEILCAS